MLGLLLAAIALGASNGAAAIGIGLGGIDRRKRLRVSIVFGVFEAGMPLVGLVLGRQIASVLGGSAQQLGGTLVVAIGLHEWFSRRGDESRVGSAIGHPVRLVVTAFALSIDNLVVGFALGSLHVSFLVAAATIGGVSAALTLVGLEIGSRLGARLARGGRAIGAVVLVLLGVVLAAGWL